MAVWSMGRRLLAAAASAALVSWLLFCSGGSAAATTKAVPVGVVLDLASESNAGRKSLACISMALEDFYSKHPSYVTRVGLHVRDSRGDPGAAGCAVEDLIMNAQVQALIVAPQSSAEADLFAQLGSSNRMPILSFSGISPTSPLQPAPFFVHTAAKDYNQVAPIAGVLTSFSWREAIVVCEDSPYGTGIIRPLADALQRQPSNKAYTIDSVVVPINVTDDQLGQVPYRLKEMPARVFIVHMRPALAVHLFSRAKDAGMMSEGYIWLATAVLGNVVDSLRPDDIYYLQGVLTLRPYVQATGHVKNLSARFNARLHLENPDIENVQNPSVLMFLAYDTAWATAIAAEIAGFLGSGMWMAETDLGQHGVLATRRPLLDSILNTTFDGMAGWFKLVNGEKQLPSYEIVDITVEGVVRLGLWKPLSLITQNLSTEGSSFDNSGSVSGTLNHVSRREDLVMTSKGRELLGSALTLDTKPSLNPEAEGRNARKVREENLEKLCGSYTKMPLKIGVPLKDGFKAFVNVSNSDHICTNNATLPSTTEQITGYSIDVFKVSMTKLNLSHQCYEFCVFKGSYDELVGNVSLGNINGAVGDVTITSERTSGAGLTMPYTQSGVSLLVLGENDLGPIQWIFLAPLTWELWVATVGFFFFTGFVVWMIERPRNPEYQGSILRQFSTASYFSFSTLTFSHDQSIRSPLSKITVVIWCFVVLILVQSYTASLSSLLTAERLRPSVTDLDQLRKNGDNVGYQQGSFVYSILRNQDWSANRLFNYSTKEEYAEALRNGSRHGGVSAIVDEIPFLTSFLSDPKYQNEFQMVNSIYKTPGFGFVFPVDFPLLNNLSTAILNLTEGEEGSRIEEKWLGTASPMPGRTNTDSTPLTLKSFSGLFLTSGSISFVMLLISIVRLVHARWIDARSANVQSTDNSVGDEESSPLQNGTGDFSVLDQPQPESRNDDYQGTHGTGGSVVEESHPIQNDIGHNSVRDRRLNEAISNDSQGVDRSSGTAGYEEPSAVHTGFVPTQSFQIEMNTGRNVGAILHGPS